MKGAIEWEIWIQNPDVVFAIEREVRKRVSTLSKLSILGFFFFPYPKKEFEKLFLRTAVLQALA